MTALMKNIIAKITTQIELYRRPTGKQLRGQSWEELNAPWMAAAEAVDLSTCAGLHEGAPPDRAHFASERQKVT